MRRPELSKKRQSDDASINIFDQIDSICAEFRKQWKVGKRPRVEGFLGQAPENAREALFRNLLAIDIRYRERSGEKPAPADYMRRFPQFKRGIGDAFHFSTSMSMEAMHSTPIDDSGDMPATVEAPAANRIGEYELIRELGRGGFGVVYEARHTKTGNRVALKTLPTGNDGQQVNADRLYRFRREFRRLSEINHPNLVGMQSLEVDGSQWFFTMDLIEGDDFLSYVRPDDRFDEARLRACLSQLAKGVIELHRRGIIHRDLKPSNVLATHDGRVTILDFGLAAELQKATDMTQTRSGMFAGTPRYAAPEQMFGERTEASDWYAFGTMLYEALTGEPPFHGKDQVALLRQKQEQDPPALSGQDRIPNDLAELADGLVRREPGERLAADAVAEQLGFDQDTQFSGSTKDSHGSTGSVDEEYTELSRPEDDEIVLVGRDEQLAQLEAAKEEFVRTRVPSVVWVTGLSGEGKSSLVENFLRPVRRGNEMLVVSGRCYDRESVPFKAVDVLIEALVGFFRTRPRDQVNGWLPKDIHMLSHMFPAMRRVEAIASESHGDISNIDDRQIRYRAFFALRDLLANVARGTPMVVFIDDLQWGDADSSEVLFDLLSPPNPPSVLLLGSYRSDEFKQSPFLQDWTRRSVEQARLTGQRVEVAPLTEEQCLEFMAQRIGISPEKLREQIHATFADTKGNPYFLEQLIEGFNRETGQFEPVPLYDIVNKKLQQLPADAADLLQVVAIAGQAVSIEEASRVAGHGTPLFSIATHMRSERLFRLIGSEELQRVDTYHDKIRESVLDTLGPSSRRSLHVKYGEWLECQHELTGHSLLENIEDAVSKGTTAYYPKSERIFDIAFHFHAAEDRRAFAYQLAAGELSHRAYASDDAIDYFRRAQAVMPDDASPEVRFLVWHRLASSLYRLCQFESAESAYESALQFAPTNLTRAQAHNGIAEVYFSLGKFTTATKHHDQALIELGCERPRFLLAYARAVVSAFRVFLLPHFSRFTNTELQVEPARALEHQIYTHIVMYKFDQAAPLIDYPYAILHIANCAIASRDLGIYASGSAMLAGHLAANGLPRLAERVLRPIKSISEIGGNLENRGISLYADASTKYCGGRHRDSEEAFYKSCSLLTESGSHMHAAIALHLSSHLHAVHSSSAKERRSAEELIGLAQRTGDVRSQCWGHYDLACALARGGDIAQARLHIRKARDFLDAGEMNLSEAIFLCAHGYVLLQSSEYAAAKRILEEAWHLAWERKLLMEWVLRCLPYLIESWVGPTWQEPSEQRTHARLRRLIRAARILYVSYPNLRSPLDRVRGRAFLTRGKSRKAVRWFERAVASAKTLDMRYDLAKSLLDLSAVKEDGRDNNRRTAISLLKETESVIPRAESWLLGDQYDEAVVAPEFDLEAWEREHGSLSDPVRNN